MMNIKKFFILLPLFSVSLLSSCYKVNKGNVTRCEIKYSEEEVDKSSLDLYFLNNEDLYPNYQKLKNNTPDLLDHTRIIEVPDDYKNDMKLIRFSFYKGGFLDNQTFLYRRIDNTDHYFHLGSAFGGTGVSEFVFRRGDAGFYLFFLYSFGSGISRSEIGIFDFFKNEFYQIEGLSLEINKNYTLFVDGQNIDIYEADIFGRYDDNNFPLYDINRKDLVIKNIDEMNFIHIEG